MRQGRQRAVRLGWGVGCLLLCASLCASAWAGETSLQIVNTSSEDATVLVTLPAGKDAPEGQIARAASKNWTCPVQTTGKERVFALPMKAMETVEVTLGEGEAAPKVALEETDGTFTVTAAGRSYRFDKTGLVAMGVGDQSMPVTQSAKTAGAQTKVVRRGGVMVELGTAKKEGNAPDVLWRVRADGSLEIASRAKVSMSFPHEGYRAWSFTQKAGCYHVVPLPGAEILEPMHGSGNSADVAKTHEWAANLPASGEGVGAGMAQGRGAHFAPEGIRHSGQFPTKKLRITLEPPPRRESTDLILSGKNGSILLYAARNKDEIRAWNRSRTGIVVLEKSEAGYTGAWGRATATVTDRNGNGKPDLQGDRWVFSNKGKATTGMECIPFADDPREQGNALHFFRDQDKNGAMDGADWKRPVWRLADWDRDGVFLAGNLVIGGRMEAGALYKRKRGSPDGKLWDYQWATYDLDGDGDGDVYVTKADYNVLEAGLLAYGTAGNREGVRFNFGDGDYAPVVEPDMLKCRMVYHRVDYSDFFFAYSGSHNTAPGAVDGYWYLNEEHDEYENFGPDFAAGHIWTFHGTLNRLIYSGMNGNWKLGLVPGIKFPHGDWAAKKIVYTDPQQREVKFVSAIKPTSWDGTALEPKKGPDGHTDLNDMRPWVRTCTSGKIKYAGIINELDFGTLASEAYVGYLPNGRGWNETGAEKYEFYYSQLAGGLHNLGSKRSTSTKPKMYFEDRDDDGIIDYYINQVEGEERTRELTYDHKKGEVVFRDGKRAVRWSEKVDPSSVPFFLEDYGKLRSLYMRGHGKEPIVFSATIDPQSGAFAGYDLPPGQSATPVPVPEPDPKLRILYDLHHARAVGDEPRAPGNSEAGLLPMLFWNGRLEKPATAEAMKGWDALVVQGVWPAFSEEELSAVGAWVKAGGTVAMVLPKGTEAVRLGANAFLKGIGAASRFGTEQLDRGYPVGRIPALGRKGGFVDGRPIHFPTTLNAREHFQDNSPDQVLLEGKSYIELVTYPIESPGTILVTYDETVPVVTTETLGKGRLVILGGPALAENLPDLLLALTR